jgi:Protein of unknown function (DUF1761)
MIFDTLGELNWLAVIVATVAYFILGALWYAPPVFGRAWQRAGGVEPQEGQQAGLAIYISPLIANFLAVVATAMLVLATGTTETSDAIMLGLVVWGGYVIGLTLLGATFDTRPSAGVWFTINAGYHLIGLVGAALIVTLWD